MNKNVKFIACTYEKTYEQQANEQGYTLGDDAEYFEKIRQAWLVLGLSNLISDNQYDIISERIIKNLRRNVKKIGSDENVYEDSQYREP